MKKHSIQQALYPGQSGPLESVVLFGNAADGRAVPTMNGVSNMMLQQQMAAALLAQSMDSAGEVSNSMGSDDLTLGASNTMPSNLFMKTNLSPGNFTKAFNFQTLAEHGPRYQVAAGDPGFGVPGEEEEDTGSDTIEDAESLTQNRFDPADDLVEPQQQARQQATLMSKFRQLREWQQRQQELLMTQQQNQLELLRSEQERIQQMVAKQREEQLRAGPLSRTGFTNTVTEGIPFSEPRQAPPRSGITLKQTMMQNARPVPVFYQHEHMRQCADTDTDRDMDSDCGNQQLPSEEGVYPLSDQETEQKQFHASSVLPQGHNTGYQHSERHPHQPQLQGTWNLSEQHYCEESDYIDDGDDEAGQRQSSLVPKTNHTDYNHNYDTLDFREDGVDIPRGGTLTENLSPRSSDQVHYRNHDEQLDETAEYQSEDESVCDDDEHECECEDMDTEFDEIPVSGLGGTKKTFEELLEEELRKEEQRMRKGGQESPVKTTSGGKHFLKKGEGVARFTSGASRERRKPQGHKRTSSNRAQTYQPEQKPPSGNATSRSGSGGSRKSGQTTGNGRSNNTPVTRGQQSKKSNVSRKVLTNATEPNTKQQQQQQRLQNKPSQQNLQKKNRVESTNHQNNEQPRTTLSLQSRKTLPAAKTEARPSSGPPPDPCDTPSKFSDTDSLGETSFQARLTARAHQEEKEEEQLEEFELLEQFADDDVSFMSNMSAVKQAVQATRGVPRNHRMPPIANIIKPPAEQIPAAGKVPVSSSTSMPCDMQAPQSPSETEEDEEEEEEEEEDSTSVSSEEDHSQSDDGNKSLGDHDSTLVESPSEQQQNLDDQSLPAPPRTAVTTNRPIQRKVAPMAAMRNSLLASVQQFSDSDADTNKNLSDLSDDEDISQSKGALYKGRLNGDQSNAASYYSRDEQTGKAGRTSQQTSLEAHNQKPNSFGVEPSLTNVLETQTEDYGRSNLQQIDFEDDLEAWNESHSEDSTPDAGERRAERADSKPLIHRSILSRNNGAGDTTEKSTPPTSQLVSKLFPKLRQEKPKPKVDPVAEARLAAASQAEVSDGVQTKLLRDKLAELEGEIEKFRSENNSLVKLRKEREEGLAQLKKEMSEFDKQKNEELKRLQDFKAEETKKLRRERKQFEQYQQTIRAMPNKKEREEIELLKTQVSDLQEEMKRKESRWTSSTARLREKCESLTTENAELNEELKQLERQRLQAWQRRETAPKLKSHEESSHPPPVKKSTMQPARSPKPESQPSLPGPRDTALSLSTNLDLDESDLRASEECPPPRGTSGASPRQLEPAFTPAPLHAGLPISPPPDMAQNGGRQKPLTRKRAVPMSLTNTIDKGDEEYQEIQHPDGKVEKVYSNGAREILYTNGTRKQLSANGESVIVSFYNGDMKQILQDQRVIYYFAEAQTTHISYPDGLEILQFPNQQIEKYYRDGTTEITFPDQTIKYLFPNGTEETIYPDGTVYSVKKNGEKTVEFPNGQREIHTQHYKRREYPDGTMKTVYPDGKQETRYSSGRVRVKDTDGNVIVDKMT